MKFTSQQYKFICELLWGGVPVERDWAEETPIFRQEGPKILEKYPKLDNSFFEQAKQEQNETRTKA